MDSGFTSWLTNLLNSKNVDGDVFGEYISGSLATMEDSTEEEVKETLTDILSGCVEDHGTCESLCHEIMERWMAEKEKKRSKGRDNRPYSPYQPSMSKKTEIQEHKTEGQPSSLLQHISTPPVTSTSGDTSSAAPPKVPGLSDLEKDRLLAQYGYALEPDSVAGVSTSRKGADSGGFFDGAFFKNVNRSCVTEEQQKLREEQKMAHESKVERDKQNRLGQKQKALDRKEKEKKRTQKQERRR